MGTFTAALFAEIGMSPAARTQKSNRRIRQPALYACLMLLLTATAFGQTPQNTWPDTESRLKTLLSGDPEQKRTALAEIRNIRSEAASRLAIPALSDGDEMVRATAASSVIFLPEAEARQVLLPLLDDKMPFVRREAAYALGRVGDWGATKRLIRLLEQDRDPEVRSAAAVALGNIGDYSAIGSLVRILSKKPGEGDDEFLRRSSARAIGQVFDLFFDGSTYTVTPQNFLPPKFKDTATLERPDELYRSIDLKAAFNTLSQVLQNQKEAEDTRREAAFALGAIRQPAATAILRSHLNSPDPYLAEICKEALLKIENGQ